MKFFLLLCICLEIFYVQGTFARKKHHQEGHLKSASKEAKKDGHGKKGPEAGATPTKTGSPQTEERGLIGDLLDWSDDGEGYSSGGYHFNGKTHGIKYHIGGVPYKTFQLGSLREEHDNDEGNGHYTHNLPQRSHPILTVRIQARIDPSVCQPQYHIFQTNTLLRIKIITIDGNVKDVVPRILGSIISTNLDIHLASHPYREYFVNFIDTLASSFNFEELFERNTNVESLREIYIRKLKSAIHISFDHSPVSREADLIIRELVKTVTVDEIAGIITGEFRASFFVKIRAAIKHVLGRNPLHTKFITAFKEIEQVVIELCSTISSVLTTLHKENYIPHITSSVEPITPRRRYDVKISSTIDSTRPATFSVVPAGITFNIDITTPNGDIRDILPRVLGTIVKIKLQHSLAHNPMRKYYINLYTTLSTTLTYDELFRHPQNEQTVIRKFAEAADSAFRSSPIYSETKIIMKKLVTRITCEEIVSIFNGEFRPSFFVKVREAQNEVLATSPHKKEFLSTTYQVEKGVKSARDHILTVLEQVNQRRNEEGFTIGTSEDNFGNKYTIKKEGDFESEMDIEENNDLAAQRRRNREREDEEQNNIARQREIDQQIEIVKQRNLKKQHAIEKKRRIEEQKIERQKKIARQRQIKRQHEIEIEKQRKIDEQHEIEHQREIEREEQIKIAKQHEIERLREIELETQRKIERQHAIELENQRKIERQHAIELENQRKVEKQREIDRQREIELEKQRKIERQHAIELENQRKIERQHAIELENQRKVEKQREIDRLREIELEKQRKIERQHAIELENQRKIEKQHEIDRLREIELEKQRKIERQHKIERENQQKIERQHEIDRLREIELEKQRKIERQHKIERENQQKIEKQHEIDRVREIEIEKQKKVERQREIERNREIKRQHEIEHLREIEKQSEIEKHKKHEKQRERERNRDHGRDREIERETEKETETETKREKHRERETEKLREIIDIPKHVDTERAPAVLSKTVANAVSSVLGKSPYKDVFVDFISTYGKSLTTDELLNGNRNPEELRQIFLEKYNRAADKAFGSSPIADAERTFRVELFKTVTVPELAGIFNGKVVPSFFIKVNNAIKRTLPNSPLQRDLLYTFEQIEQGVNIARTTVINIVVNIETTSLPETVTIRKRNNLKFRLLVRPNEEQHVDVDESTNGISFKITTREFNVNWAIPQIISTTVAHIVEGRIKHTPYQEYFIHFLRDFGKSLTFDELYYQDNNPSELKNIFLRKYDIAANKAFDRSPIAREEKDFRTELLRTVTVKELAGLYNGKPVPSFFDKVQSVIRQTVSKGPIRTALLETYELIEAAITASQQTILTIVPHIQKMLVSEKLTVSKMVNIKFHLSVQPDKQNHVNIDESRDTISYKIITTNSNINWALPEVNSIAVAHIVQDILEQSPNSETFVKFLKVFGKSLTFDELFEVDRNPEALRNTYLDKYSAAADRVFGPSPIAQAERTFRNELFKTVTVPELAGLFNGKYVPSFFIKVREVIGHALNGNPFRAEFLRTFDLIGEGVALSQPTVTSIIAHLQKLLASSTTTVSKAVKISFNAKLRPGEHNHVDADISPDAIKFTIVTRDYHLDWAIPEILGTAVAHIVKEVVGKRLAGHLIANMLKSFAASLTYDEMFSTDFESQELRRIFANKLRNAMKSAFGSSDIARDAEEVFEEFIKIVDPKELAGLFNGNIHSSIFGHFRDAINQILRRNSQLKEEFLQAANQLEQALTMAQQIVKPIVPNIRALSESLRNAV